MLGGMWEIAFYKNSRGDPLVYNFVAKQDKAVQSKAARSFTLMRQYGPDLGMPYGRYLGSGLYELRVRANNEVRIFYCTVAKRRIIMMLHAFKKRTQKIPAKELNLARKRQNELTEL